ncbi:Hypothetical protein A7982_04457 [Minicystis rosea]|nr:Hypothetical protein A7982_04457 [Minicystis rosea]
MLRDRLPAADPGSSRVEDARGTAIFSEPAPGVLLVRIVGHVTLDAANAAIALRRKALRTTPILHLFDDAWEAIGYDSDVRLRLTTWAKENSDRIGSHHLLIRSKILAMGVSVANMALKNRITAHTAEESFAAALRDACRTRR